MAQHKEHLWQAYIDGELSAAEASEFENSLSAAQRELLAADARFERRLNEKLSQPLGIPADLWERTVAKLDAGRAAQSPPAKRRVSPWAWAATVAAAAAVALLISGRFPSHLILGPPSIALAAEDLGALSVQVQTEPTQEAVSAFLAKHDVNVGLALDVENLYAVQVQRHRIRFLGAGSTEYRGEVVPQLYFACCKQPEKVLIVRSDSAAARAIKKSFGNTGDVQAVRDAGEYLVAVVGKHQAYDLLDTVIAQ